MLTLVGLVLLLIIAINLTPVQNFLARRATQVLARKLHTTVSVKHVRIDLLNHLLLQGLYIEDHHKDTLLYAGEAQVRITDWFFVKDDKPVITYVGLKDVYGHLYRTATSKEWNYQFVLDAFDNGKKDKTKSQNEFELDLKKVELQRLRFHMDDAWVGNDMDFDIGSFKLDGKDLDLKKKVIDLNSIAASDANIVMRDYPGGRPKGPNRKKQIATIDTTAFNPDNWVVKVNKLTLDHCLYSLTSSSKPAPQNQFDETHLAVSKIMLDARNIRIDHDTITGHILNMSGRERCGLGVRSLVADVKVSPNISSVSHMLLKTDKSVLQDYYAMHYERFPDFLDYIHKVKMEGSLDKAVVSGDEVAYFAPVLRQYHAVVKASGKFYGSVDSLSARNMLVTDGTSIVKGNLAMIGLPDIDKTLISYSEGTIVTNGEAVMRYAPELRNNPNIDVERLSFVTFNGGFTGYISNFAANGTLNTNLGTVTSVAKLNLPGLETKNAAYSGTVSARGFNLGTLLRQPYLGAITFKADVSGNGFDANAAGVKVNAFIDELGLNGYNYHKITAEGILAKKKFDGKIIVDDTNLALAFNGAADFSGTLPVINATANLLKSDLQKIRLLDEPVSAAADFDLNMTGSTIDNFLGSAKLYNINLLRGTRRVDLDSVTLHANLLTEGKVLIVESNDLSARISGVYQLSQLPYSTQYFLSRYMPNYIKAPKKYAPDQDITFDITTRNMDSLLRVLSPNVRGFDNSTISGSMNTTSQELHLSAQVPYGILGNVQMQHVNLKGSGNFSSMVVNGEAGSILVGDSLLSISLNLDSRIGNDSVGFNITTSSPGVYGTATINGGAVALGDSLLISMLPSEVFLSGNRWEIPGGSQIVVARNYLMVRDLYLNSGLQKISVYTEDERTKQSVLVDAQNLDLAQLGGIAGFSDYQPDGRINANVRIDQLFKDMTIAASAKATGVKLGTDTIGEINISGNYNAAKKLITLDEGSGIFRGSASLAASGTISFDSTSHQHLDGRIKFQDAPISWVSPVLNGFVSNIGGTLNGNIKIGGTGFAPDVDGSVSINKAIFRVDYLGTTYTIPDAVITLNNQAIDVGTVKLYDVFNNEARLTGRVTHDRFKDFRLALRLTTDQFEAINLRDYENSMFYGNVVARATVSITGPINDLRMNISNAAPAKASHIYLPISSGGALGSYTYVSFKQYGQDQLTYTGSKNKLSINIVARINPLIEVTMILDPATGDQINARGSGNLTMDVPADGDLSLFGPFNIDEGNYIFTFRQLFFKRQFQLNSGSKIMFNGPIAQTNLDVNATYRTRASLYDLLSDDEKRNNFVPAAELSDTRRPQDVNVILHMGERLQQPSLTFKLELPEKRSVTTYAYTKLERINNNDRELFDQVASLLLIGYFIPPEGIAGSTAATGAINNMSEIISTTTSGQLTNIVNKLLGDPKLSIDLKYKNYNLNDGTSTDPLNRNEVKLGVRQNFLDDRLVVEVGSSYDWGRPTTSNTANNNFNLLNNFRVQYLLNKEGRVRLNGFRTSDYDVLLENGGGRVTRAGIGISWRKTFNTFSEFFHNEKYYARKKRQLEELEKANTDSVSVKKTIGTE